MYQDSKRMCTAVVLLIKLARQAERDQKVCLNLVKKGQFYVIALSEGKINSVGFTQNSCYGNQRTTSHSLKMKIAWNTAAKSGRNMSIYNSDSR